MNNFEDKKRLLKEDLLNNSMRHEMKQQLCNQLDDESDYVSEQQTKSFNYLQSLAKLLLIVLPGEDNEDEDDLNFDFIPTLEVPKVCTLPLQKKISEPS